MSLKIVVVAVICIIVLVVLIMIFTGKTRFFGQTTSGCPARGGQCMDAPCPPGWISHPGAACENEQVCCAQFEGASAES